MNNTIYKRDNSGKVRYLTVSTDGGMLVQTSGVMGTENPIVHIKQCKGKNIGKNNETSPTQQAESEGQSKLVEKLRQGYFESIEEAEQKGGKDFLMPMLAHKYEDYKNDIVFPCFVQPKLDGCRSLSSIEAPFISRTNKPFENVNHIVLPDFQVTFDGELYVHGLSFQENMKLIKKYRKGETEQVKYHVYDIVSDAPFSERNAFLKQIINHPNIVLVPTYIVNSMEEVNMYHKQFLLDGYEGTMIRWGEKSYDVNHRSKYLIKYKDFIDEAYKVVNVIPSDARPEQGVVVCQNDRGDTFGCGMKFSHAEREEILLNKEKYLGEMAEVRFFEFSDTGIPRFPICVGFRIDK